MSQDKVGKAFDKWWIEHEAEMSSEFPRPSERLAWNASRARALKEMREGLPEPLEGDTNWNECLAALTERLDRMEKQA